MMDSFDDRRTFQRFKAKRQFITKYFGDSVYSEVELQDFSRAGLRLKANKCFDSDKNIMMVFDGPNNKKQIAIEGRIVWTKNDSSDLWDVGIEFKNISFYQMNALFKALYV